jgi:hypothetical protein
MKQTPPSRESWAARLRSNAERANAERGAKPRNRVLVIVDIVAGIILSFLALGIAIAVATYASRFPTVHLECTPELVDGLTCNGTALAAVTVVLMAVAILGFVVAVGMVLVNLIRRRWTFWWPLAFIVVAVGLFYLGTWIVSMTIPAAVAS